MVNYFPIAHKYISHDWYILRLNCLVFLITRYLSIRIDHHRLRYLLHDVVLVCLSTLGILHYDNLWMITFFYYWISLLLKFILLFLWIKYIFIICYMHMLIHIQIVNILYSNMRYSIMLYSIMLYSNMHNNAEMH